MGAEAMLIDYHMHLERGGLTREYLLRFVETARARGVDEIGITEHAYNFVEGAPLLGRPWYVERYSSGFRMADYIALLQAARAEGLPVKAGIEMDYVPGREEDIRAFLAAYPLDFVIGSVHWIDDWGFDLDPASWPGRDVREAYRRYFDLAERAIRSGLFDVFGHPDVIKVFGYKLPPEYRDELAEYHRRLARAAAEAGVCLEISSAGVRKPVGEFYPDPGILDEARRLGVRVTLASDAHEPEHVGWAYPELVAYARAHGFETVTVFEGRVGRQEPLG